LSTLGLIIHRSAHEIGGNCIELIDVSGSRLILDVGRPLDAPRGLTGLMPATIDLAKSVEGILISHPHQDHYGLLDEAPAHWPVYCGSAAGKLIGLTASIYGNGFVRPINHWKSSEPFKLGPFRVTPLLTDHSAFDAYMLLIEVSGKKVLYSGDFRIHGRKASLVRRLMETPPEVDVLLMEGTNLGSDKPTKSETDLEDEFVALFRETPGRVFVCWSAQNIDRTVSIYRACIKTNRTLVVDLYTAEVLELISEYGRLPRAGLKNLKVVVTRRFANLYRQKGRENFVDRMAAHGVSAAAIAENPRRWVTMIRPSLIDDFSAKGVQPTPDDAWSYSQWKGYLAQPDGMMLQRWFDQGGAKARHIHTSGHASQADLQAFSSAIKPRMLVPIHGVAWDSESAGFAQVCRLRDGEMKMI